MTILRQLSVGCRRQIYLYANNDQCSVPSSSDLRLCHSYSALLLSCRRIACRKSDPKLFENTRVTSGLHFHDALLKSFTGGKCVDPPITGLTAMPRCLLRHLSPVHRTTAMDVHTQPATGNVAASTSPSVSTKIYILDGSVNPSLLFHDLSTSVLFNTNELRYVTHKKTG